MLPLITGAGVELSGNAKRIAEVVQDFDDTLELQWIPPAERSPFGEAPYRIVQFHPNYEPYVVMEIQENQLDQRVVAALFKARNFNLTEQEAKEAAQSAMKMREQMDEAEEDAKFTKWAINSTKTVKHNGRVYT